VNDAFTNFNCRLRDVGGRVTAIIDDNYGIGPPSELFAANTQFAIELATVGLEAQPSKAECYIDEAYRNADWHTARGDIPEGILKNADGTPAQMIMARHLGVQQLATYPRYAWVCGCIS